MQISGIIPQLRTTDLARSIDFYTSKLGFILAFQYEDFYAGIRLGGQMVHLKHVDCADPSIAFVDDGGHFHLYLETDDVVSASVAMKQNGIELEQDVHDTPWGTRECVLRDDQGHTLYVGQPLPTPAQDAA